MFDRPDIPRDLQTRLAAFFDHWHDTRRPWYGIADEKLAATQLPEPLRWFYGFAGEWPSTSYWDHLLGKQDCLVPFEMLSVRDSKLEFVWENQGCWSVGTELTGDDPPAYVSVGNGPWVKVEDSLTRFLVTFVLHETVFCCRHRAHVGGAAARIKAAGGFVVPLWLQHRYPRADEPDPWREVDFHVADRSILIMDDYWVATDSDDLAEKHSGLFAAVDGPQVTRWNSFEPMPETVNIPATLRRSHLDNLILKHEQAGEYHADRVAMYTKLRDKIE